MYGLWILVSAVVGVALLAEGGVSTATTYHCAQDLARGDNEGLSRTLTASVIAALALSTAVMLILLLGADNVGIVFRNLTTAQVDAVSTAVKIGAVAVALLTLQNVAGGMLHAVQRYDLSNILSTVQLALATTGYIALSARGGGVVEFVQWQVAINAIVLLAYVGTVAFHFRPYRVQFAWSRTRAGTLWRYSATIWGGSLGGILFTQVDRLIVAGLLGPAALAVYAVITSTARQISAFSGMPVQPLMPELSRLAAQSGINGEIRHRIRVAFQVVAYCAIGMGVALFTLAPIVLGVLLGRPATDSEVMALRLASTIYALLSINGAGYYILLGLNDPRSFMLIQLSSGALAALLVMIGARFGLIWAIAGNAGFLGVTAFSIIGMKRAGVSLETWTAWIRTPVLLFSGAVLGIILVPAGTTSLVLFTLIELILLTTWFARSQPNLFHLMSRMRVRP